MTELVVTLGAEMSRVQHRLAVGVQVVDTLSGRPLLAPLHVRLLQIGPLQAELPLLSKGGGRYSLADTGAFARLWDRTTEPGRLLPRTLDLIAHEAKPGRRWHEVREGELPHRHGPRRVRLQLDETLDPRPRPAASRANTLVMRLFPGPAYPFDGGATLLRGRVQLRQPPPLAPLPARWARLVATKGGRVVGATQADERGEYALLLRYPAGLLAPATPAATDGDIQLHVAARSAPPAHRQPFDDLSTELGPVAALDTDPLADMPANYDLSVTLPRTLNLGRPHSGPDYDFLLPPA